MFNKVEGLSRKSKALLFLIATLLVLAGTLTSCLPSLQIPQAEDLIWDTWRAIKEDYLYQEQIDVDRVVKSAIQNMLKIAGESPQSFFIELENVSALPPSQVPSELEDVWRAWELLLERHPELDQERLAEAAAKGLLQGLNDPLVQYIGKDELKEAEIRLKGKYEGIGVTVSLVKGDFIVVALIPDGPAEKAGLQPGDIIKSVNGETVKGLSLQELADRIRGPAGSTVTLEIFRPKKEKTQTVQITRGAIDLPSTLKQVLPDHIGYLAILIFRETTGKEVRKDLKQLQDKGIKALILDLRNNPGGSLDAAVEVASQFISKGLILSFVKPNGSHEDIYAKSGGIFLQPPLAVVVNGFTASAAEVVAAALQDYHRAKIFGTTTFGKGVSNIFRELDSKAAVVLPTSEWHRPSGKTINKIGVKPDVEVNLTLQDILQGQDTQLLKAYHYLKDLVSAAPEKASLSPRK